jgi:hypothetical protein
MAKDVAKASSKELAQLSEMDALFEQHKGAGLQNVTAQDVLIPRLQILQALSPQIDRRDSAYIEGAVAGQICDLGMGELYEDAIQFLPVYFVKQWLEWAPRNTGKGLQGIHKTDAILAKTKPNDRNKPVLDNGNLIVETHQFYGLNLTAGGRKVFIPMASTQIKKARLINTWATDEKVKRPDGSEFTPPLWFRSIKLGTVPEDNAEGKWIGWKPERSERLVDLPDFRIVRDRVLEFQDALEAGTVRGDLNDLQDDPAAGGGSSASGDGEM